MNESEGKSESKRMGKYLNFKEKLNISDIWTQIKASLPPKEEIKCITCLGLGSPLESNQALIQLALVGLINDHFKPGEVLLWDPIFNKEDITFIESFGYKVEEEGSYNKHHLYYLPHFPIEELEKFINDGKPQYLLSNDLTEYAIKLTDLQYFQKYPTCATMNQLLDPNSGGSVDDGFTIVKKKKKKKKQHEEQPTPIITYNLEEMYFSKVHAIPINYKKHSDLFNGFTDLSMMTLT